MIAGWGIKMIYEACAGAGTGMASLRCSASSFSCSSRIIAHEWSTCYRSKKCQIRLQGRI